MNMGLRACVQEYVCVCMNVNIVCGVVVVVVEIEAVVAVVVVCDYMHEYKHVFLGGGVDGECLQECKRVVVVFVFVCAGWNCMHQCACKHVCVCIVAVRVRVYTYMYIFVCVCVCLLAVECDCIHPCASM